MKKVSAVLISVLLVIMSVPSISSRADVGAIFRAITSDIFEDQYGSEALSWVSPQFSRSESYFDDFTSTDYDFLNNPSNYPFDITSDRVIYSFGGFNAAKGNMQIVALDFSEISGDLYSVFTNVNGITVASTNTAEQVPPATGYYLNYSPYSHSFIQSSTFELSGSRGMNARIVPTFIQNDPNPDPDGKQKASVESLNELYTFYNYSSSYLSYMFYTNCQHYYSSNQFWDSYVATDSTVGSQISNNFGALNLFDSLCTDYLDGGFSSYFDGNGVVTPERPDDVVIEDNTNHLFLTNFDTGFCKPYSLDDLYRAGGGYAYFSYNFDSWINSHSSQYELHVQTTLNVDNTEYIYNTVKGLDLQGLNVFSLKELASSYPWEYENMLFVEYPDVLFNNYNRGYLYSMTYTNAYGDSSTNFISRALGTGGRSNRLFYSSNGSTRQLTSSQPDSNIENIWVGEERTKFLITFDIVLYDTISQESSDHFTETHNLITGTSTVSSNGISDNKNPFENYNGDDPYLPVDDSGGGYSVSQSYGYVNNINIPSNYTVTYRDGVNSFIEWYNKDPSTTGIMNSFWGMMGVFRNNPATDIYEDYWGFLPSGFKNLILACASLGIIGFAATVLRKRLMR